MADCSPEKAAGYERQDPSRGQVRCHLGVPPRQDDRLHGERQSTAEDRGHGNECDARHDECSQRAERAPPLGQRRVDALEDDSQDHRGGQEADGHEALLNDVLDDRDLGEEPEPAPAGRGARRSENAAHSTKQEAEEPQSPIPPEGHQPRHHHGRKLQPR